MTNDELQVLVERISLKYFNKPFRHQATFNSRLRTTGGRYLLSSHNIELNFKYYKEQGKEALIGIIKHELCHYHLHLANKGYKHGDEDFKQLMCEVGAPRYCKPLEGQAVKVVTHLYQCRECGFCYKRKRRVNVEKYVCGKCRGKLYKV